MYVIGDGGFRDIFPTSSYSGCNQNATRRNQMQNKTYYPVDSAVTDKRRPLVPRAPVAVGRVARLRDADELLDLVHLGEELLVLAIDEVDLALLARDLLLRLLLVEVLHDRGET